jgi:predicted nucleic acid-binding protein
LATNADLLLDTSAAVPFLVSDHLAHRGVFDALCGKRLGLAGHAALETFSVVTRLPDTRRMSPQGAARMLQQSFPHTVHLGAARAARMMALLAELSISGGAVYDALVAAAAVEHQRPLASRDRRALSTYASLGAEVVLLD